MNATTVTAATTASATTEASTEGSAVTWKRGLLTGLGAACVATAIAGVLDVAGHALSVVDADGRAGAIPVLAFAQMVLLGTVIGIVVARRTSRRTFVRATVVLTALSCVPSLAWGVTAGDKVGLVLTHVVAAAIVIPRLARR
jgi:Family of unknown function (DUF6069)